MTFDLVSELKNSESLFHRANGQLSFGEPDQSKWKMGDCQLCWGAFTVEDGFCLECHNDPGKAGSIRAAKKSVHADIEASDGGSASVR